MRPYRGHARRPVRPARALGGGHLQVPVGGAGLLQDRLRLHLRFGPAQRDFALRPPGRAEFGARGRGCHAAARHGSRVPRLLRRRDLQLPGERPLRRGAARRVRRRVGGYAGGGAAGEAGGVLQGHASPRAAHDACEDERGRALRRGGGGHGGRRPHVLLHAARPRALPRPRRARRRRLRAGRLPGRRRVDQGELAARSRVEAGHGDHSGARVLLHRLPHPEAPGRPPALLLRRRGSASRALGARRGRPHRGRRRDHGGWLQSAHLRPAGDQ
mmetsp:Transcript_50460/g.127164  ORF Transcript_50460/g.127164 Transcript_50460/m.127164 type:complete len:272 (+) Transcript_50460:726-1541(+)